MTVQIPDRIVLEGTEHPLFCEPPIFGTNYTPGPPAILFTPSTALPRGYVATWAIRDRVLYLDALSAKACLFPLDRESLRDPSRKTHEISVGLLETHGTAGPIPSDWISQDLCIGYGQLEPTGKYRYGIIPSHFRVISVEKGRVINDRVIENTSRSWRMLDETPNQPAPRPSWLKRLLAPFQ